MSAISVVWNHANEPSAKLLHDPMLSAQSMYGQGSSFAWSDRHIALGGTLSNFLPEDRFDRQPLWSADRSSCLVADVRLDNRPDLVRELNLVHPEELSDSSILMTAWQRWGPACLDHIVGGFAFAVWTPGCQELFAARDHAGERPLYYNRGEHLFALSSMPKGLLALPGVFRGFEESKLVDWFGLLIPDWNSTLFAGVERVPFGHWIKVTPNSFECRRYWHPANATPTRFKRDEEYSEALLEIFDRATEARLRTTKSVGSLLSAGLDSSSVTASAACQLAVQGKSLTAFTSVPRPEFNNISEPWDIVNEGPMAKEVARLYPNIKHVLVDSTGYDLVPNMHRWTDAWDEPALNLVNLLWFTAIFDRAREQGINVILDGTMGNGTISWQTMAILPHFLYKGQWVKFAKTAYNLRRNGWASMRGIAKVTLGDFVPAWCTRMLVPSGRLKNPYSPLAHPDFAARHALQEKVDWHLFGNTINSLAAEHAIYIEQTDMGPIHAAVQAVAQVDFRDPTADKRIYDFCFSIPPEQYVVGGNSRSLVRRAMKGRLPADTLSRRTRGLQGADWYLAMKDALPSLRKEVALQQQSPIARQTVDLQKMENLLDTWPESGFQTAPVVNTWHAILTRGISMGYFLRSHDPAVTPPPATDSPAVTTPPEAPTPLIAPHH